MIPVTPEMQNLIDQKAQSPICAILAQTSTPDGTKPGSQIVLGKVLSYEITRSEDASSDVCKLTLADDDASYFSSNQGGAYAPLFLPGPLDTKIMVYLGFEGSLWPNDSSRFVPYNRQLVLKFTGNIESDANVDQNLNLDKTLSLIDLTKQFRFPVNDTYPHPLYGNQTLAYFDPTYNLTPMDVDANGNCAVWGCIGKMFTVSSGDLVYGSTHSPVYAYIDTTGGQNPQAETYGDVSHYAMEGFTGIASNYSFDYKNGVLTLNTPVPATSVVSIQGNPTYMAPEVMIKKILVELADWDPKFLNLDPTNILLPMFNGNGMSAWDCLKMIASITCPRFEPWMLWCDENGVINFYEKRYDGPPVKTFLEGENIITGNYENSSRQLRTVVRADGYVPVDDGGTLTDQQVTSIAYSVTSINIYGQTEPLEVDQTIVQNVASMSPTAAENDLNMYTAAILTQVGRPILTCSAEIWPDPSIQPGDKVRIRNTRLGFDKDWIVKETDESCAQKQAKHTLSLQEFYDSVNFSIGTPAVVASTSTLATQATTPPPTIAIIGAIRLGNGANQQYSILDGDVVTDTTGMPVIPIWDATDTSDPMHFDIFLNSLPQAGETVDSSGNAPQSIWTYTLRPPGYGWKASKNSAGQTVYYGTNPANGFTVYVGPDGVYYEFDHAPPIQPDDFLTPWSPPGTSLTSPATGGSQNYNGQNCEVYVWSWFHLCLDSSEAVEIATEAYAPVENYGKFYRPIMRVNPAQDAQGISIGATDGAWIRQTWDGPPVPTGQQVQTSSLEPGPAIYGSGSSQSPTFELSAAPAQGTLIVVEVTTLNNGTAPAFTVPDGWTPLDNSPGTGTGDCGIFTLYRQTDATDKSATYTFTNAFSASQAWQLRASTFTGQSAASPIVGHSVYNTASDETSISLPAVAANGLGNYALSMAATAGTNEAPSTDTSWLVNSTSPTTQATYVSQGNMENESLDPTWSVASAAPMAASLIVIAPQSTGTVPCCAYYGNLVVGCSDYTFAPDGFIGADVMGDGVNVGVAYGPPIS